MPAKKNLPANIDKELEEEARKISSSIGGSGDFIKLDMDNGAFFEIPGLGNAEPPMEVVVVDFVSQNLMYPPYQPGVVEPPYCWAVGKDIDAMAPSDKVAEPESETCARCPNNEFGSRGAGKACKNTRLLALLPPDADENEAIRFLSVSPTGLKSFDSFVSGVAARWKKPPVGATVEISIVPAGKSYTVAFGNAKPNPMYKEHFMRRAEASAVLLAENFGSSGGDDKKPARKKAARRRQARA